MKREKTTLRACIASFACGALVLSTPLGALADTADDGTDNAGTVYNQSAGYEPYQGWQSTIDPEGHSGGGTPISGGYVSWALTNPTTLGGIQSDGNTYTYSQGEVEVIVDTNASQVTDGSVPAYYKNIILDAQPLDANSDGIVDDNDTLTFDFLITSIGGRNMLGAMYKNYDPLAGTGGVIVSTSADPSDWGDSNKVVWTGTDDNTVAVNNLVGGNWQNRVSFNIPAKDLQDAGDTLYLVLESGINAGNSVSKENIVFEFSTTQSSTWTGDVTRAGAVSAQGETMATGLVGKAACSLTCDLTASGCWLNTVSGGLTPDSSGNVSLTMFASASGSNWQTIDSWSSNPFCVYTQNPVADSNAAAIADNMDKGGVSLVAQERIWADGVTVTMSGLTAGQTYYLVVPAGFSPGGNNSSQALLRPIVYRFTVAGSGTDGSGSGSGGTTTGGGGGGVTAPAAHEHVYGEGVITLEPTCTAEGVKTFACTQEGCTETKTEAIPALGHQFGEWIVTTPATVEAEGVETRTCSVCGEAETRAIDKIAGDSSTDDGQVKVGTTATVSGITYKVSAKGEVKVTKVATSKKTATVPATVKVKGKSCKVVGIAASALKNSKATTLVIKSKLLTKKSVKNSLKGSKVTTVKVNVSSKKSTNKSYAAKYKKFFTKANCGKKVTVKY